MSELLLEIFSEEIPARMQARAADDLGRAVNKALLDAGFMPEGVKAFAGPRRLVCVAAGLPARQPDRREEKKGPRVGAPEKAVEGFLKSAGLSSLEDCEIRSDKKGEFYVAVIEQTGRETSDVIAEFVPEIIRGFSWPKSMRWGDGDMRWVRPLHRILCVFDGEPVPFEIAGLTAGDETEGHRFMAPGVIAARSFEDYTAKLRAAKVVLDTDERKEMIAADAATLCKAQGLELVDDPGLLSEVAGLAEWPVPMMGSFDEKFLKLPDEVLTASMRGHQKYFSVRDPKTGRLANKFVCVANIEAPDGGAAMRTGYERVLTARLSDAWYLYNQDLKTDLNAYFERLADVKFSSIVSEQQEKIQAQSNPVDHIYSVSSIYNKQWGVSQLASEISGYFGAPPELSERAAKLAKADLATGMVYEFPELQGIIGRYYALEQHIESDVADAIRDHYLPLGPGDSVPTKPISACLAVADKLHTICAFFGAEEQPTGSRDPYGLRRMAIGVIRILLEGNFRLALSQSLRIASAYAGFQGTFSDVPESNSTIERVLSIEASIAQKVLSFLHDRLKVYLRDKGHRHDHIDAVLTDADGNLQDDLVLIVAKLKALEAFLKTDDGANLAAAYKRAANILKAEDKKGALPDDLPVNKAALAEQDEKALFSALETAEGDVRKAVEAEEFESAMTALASLRAPIDAFFETVTVNADDKNLRANRLALLQRFIDATGDVADFSRLEG